MEEKPSLLNFGGERGGRKLEQIRDRMNVWRSFYWFSGFSSDTLWKIAELQECFRNCSHAI
jgi:hypothetical protein